MDAFLQILAPVLERLSANATVVALAAAGGFAVLVLVLALSAARRRARDRSAAEREQALRLEAARHSTEQGFAELRGRLAAIAELSAAREADLASSLNQRFDQMSQRLGDSLQSTADRLTTGLGSNLADASRRTSESLGQLGERLAVLDRAQLNLSDLSAQVLGLRDVLSDKQARGAFGQGRMEAIIEDGLPRGAYEFQATLSNGKRPDCLIRLPSSPLPLAIDAKFPLEGFEALRLAANAEAEQVAAGDIRTAIGRHVADIAEKYLIPGETQDMALMFVPSESIYGSLNERFGELVQMAHRARVLIVSPNMLMLAVQTMLAIVRDVRMREQAGVIQREVGLLMSDVGRLAERSRELERHYAAGSRDIEKVMAAIEKITARGRRIENAGLEEADAKPAAAVPVPRALAAV